MSSFRTVALVLVCLLPSTVAGQVRARRNAVSFEGMGMRDAPPMWTFSYERVLRGELRARIGNGGREQHALGPSPFPDAKLQVWPMTLQVVRGRGSIRAELGGGVVLGWDDGRAFQLPVGVIGVRFEPTGRLLLRIAAMPLFGRVESPYWANGASSVALSLGIGRRF